MRKCALTADISLVRGVSGNPPPSTRQFVFQALQGGIGGHLDHFSKYRNQFLL